MIAPATALTARGHGNEGVSSMQPQDTPSDRRCSMCGESKPRSEFNRRRKGSVALQSRCKPCNRQYQRAWAAKPENRLRAAAATRASKKRYPERNAARTTLKNAIRDGKVIRPDHCSRCGGGDAIQGHHADYSKPLEVEWLCRTCHEDEHHGEHSASSHLIGLSVSGEGGEEG